MYSGDEDLDLNGSAEDDEAYCRIQASGLQDTQPTDDLGQDTIMYKRFQEEYNSYKRHVLTHGAPEWAK